MSRLTTAALCATLLASACKVQRTPPEYIDHQDPIAVVRDAAADELQDRLLAMGQALGRGDRAEALQALAPAADAYLVVAGREGILTGEEQIGAALAEFTTLDGPSLLGEVLVTVGPRANVAWFRARLDHAAADGPAPFRITGVYIRGDEGEWQLVQAHLSAATPPPEPLTADSLPQNPEPAAVPPGGG